MSKFCQDCQFWIYAYGEKFEQFGTCDYPCMEDKLHIDLDVEAKAEEKVIHTHAFFGCLYFTAKHGNVVAHLPKLSP